MLRRPRPRPRGLAAPRSSVSAPLRPAQRPNQLRPRRNINFTISNKSIQKLTKQTGVSFWLTIFQFLIKFDCFNINVYGKKAEKSKRKSNK